MNKYCAFCRTRYFWPGLLSFTLFIVYFIPFLTGGDSHVLIHDNLDSTLVWIKVLAESGKIFGNYESTIPNIMNGLPRNVFGTEFNFILWLFYFLEPYSAYVLNLLFIRTVAFVGMFLLIKNHLFKNEPNNWILFGVALSFSLLPFWPFGGLSVAGQPLALYAFLNFRKNNQTIRDWIAIFIIPFYSSLVLSFLFFLIAISLLWLYDVLLNKKINRVFLGAIALMSITFILVDYRLFYSILFDSGFVSHRIEFKSISNMGLIGSTLYAVRNSLEVFFKGQYHAASLHGYFILLSVILAFTIVLVQKIKEKRLFIIILLVALTSIAYGFWGWEPINIIKEQIGVLASFQFSRFHFLQPLLWYMAFAISLNILNFNLKLFPKFIVSSLLIFQLLFVFSYHDAIRLRNAPTYNEFFSVELFDEVAKHIGKPKEEYRIISVGLHPSILQYNGFYTLDGYFANYPLSYKHNFRQVIEKELEKNNNIKNYFDLWGSRCYAFSSELGRDYSIITPEKINNLEFNFEHLKNLGCGYIVSRVEIDLTKNEALILRAVFSKKNSCWTIYLYELV